MSPLSGQINDVLPLIALLLLLHKQLRIDSGYLTKNERARSYNLDLSKVANVREHKMSPLNVYYSSDDVFGNLCKLNAQHTWIYPVNCWLEDAKGAFEFRWGFNCNDGFAVYQFLLEHNVTYVSTLRFSVDIFAKGSESNGFICKDEATAIDDVGKPGILKLDERQELGSRNCRFNCRIYAYPDCSSNS
ncbi:hypothetical protein BX667DRAFT_215027 [Coemansia mojavensis]|nr:hypothetical protein BX667DRAFT_215027 [Coemansia mojavensis]